MVGGLGRVPPGQRPPGALRRRALLRRLPQQPGVRAAGARGRRPGGRVAPRAVRHERRDAAARRRACRPGGRRVLRRRRRRRRPPARRRRHRGRQRARRRARRRHPGAGDDQRVRRAHRELQPDHDHPEPHAEDGRRDDSARPARAAHAGRASRRRAREHGPEPAGRVRRLVGVRAQGAACTPARSPASPTRTSTYAPSWSATARTWSCRSSRAQQPRDEGEGARHRARRAPAQRDRRHAEAARARGLPLRGGRRVAGAAHAAGDRVAAALVPRRRHGRSSSRTPATTSACRPRRSCRVAPTATPSTRSRRATAP